MPKKKKTKDEKVVHVRLDKPIPIRKSVLSTAIDAANMLTIYEQVMLLRRRRTKILDSINGKVNEVHKLFKELDEKYLPKIPIDEVSNDIEEYGVLESLNVASNVVHDDNSDYEVESLKNELAEIERKLRHL